MISKALPARFESRTGRDDEIERLLARDRSSDNGARFAHMTGHVPCELAKHALTLLGGMPDMHLLDVVVVSHHSTVAA